MADKGIIFSAPMVRALIDGRKTQTRRLLNLPTKTHSGGIIYERKDMGGWEPTTNGGAGCFTIGKGGEKIPAPETVGIWHRTCGVCTDAPFQIGDRLYVREAWRVHRSFDDIKGSELEALCPRVWPELDRDNCDAHGRYRHARFMPRWASRMWLLVTDVRVQRLQDISEDDAKAEGVPDRGGPRVKRSDGLGFAGSAQLEFRQLWDSLHTEPRTRWEDNPWIVAVSFEVHHGNIDARNAA